LFFLKIGIYFVASFLYIRNNGSTPQRRAPLSSPTRSTTEHASASPALAWALARIARAFANPDGGNKRRARDAFCLGATHPATRARYGVWADTLCDRRLDLAGAIIVLERAYGQERARHQQSRRTWGSSIRPRLELMILGELRLIGRWLRRHAPGRFPDILDNLTTPIGRPVGTVAATIEPA
jgi:hypothetical protein